MNKKVLLDYDEFALGILEEELASRYDYYWKDKNGTIINVKEIPIAYLKNIIAKLKDKFSERKIIEENYVDALDYYD